MTNRRFLSNRSLIAIALAVATFLTLWLLGTSPASLGRDPEVLQTVDELFTAINRRDPQQVLRCEEQLRRLQAKEAISLPAWRSLNRIVAKTRSDQWDAAAKELYRFSFQQRG